MLKKLKKQQLLTQRVYLVLFCVILGGFGLYYTVHTSFGNIIFPPITVCVCVQVSLSYL